MAPIRRSAATRTAASDGRTASWDSPSTRKSSRWPTQPTRASRHQGAMMEQLFDDLDDFGAFDDAISGDVRDPYTELARLRREEPVQRLETSGALPHEESLPMFIVYRYEEVQQMLRDNETFSSSGVIAAFGPVLGEGVMLGMDEPIHGRLRSLVQ